MFTKSDLEENKKARCLSEARSPASSWMLLHNNFITLRMCNHEQRDVR